MLNNELPMNQFYNPICLLSSVVCLLTSYESRATSDEYMQNKANLLDNQMNVNSLVTKDYENKIAFGLPKNKPNTNPIQSQSKPIQTQSNPINEKPEWM